MGCVVSNNPAFAFVHIPKTAGTSVSIALMKNKQCEGLTFMRGHRYLRNMLRKNDLDSHFIFSIVRNPYDRFISLWLTRRGKYGMSLNEFIEKIKSKKLRWYALRPQLDWIADPYGELLVNKVVHFEELNSGIKSVMKRLGLRDIILPHLRKTDRVKDYRSYYDSQDQIDFVKEFYKTDLDRFKYSYKGS